MADVLTIRERLGRLEGVRLAYIGDGNNVCVSLAEASRLLGLSFVAAAPPGYEPPLDWVEVTNDPRAASGADVLYTDVWTSMGQDEERARRLEDFRGFTVDAELVLLAAPSAIVSTACPRTTVRRSPRTCSARSRPSGTRPRTACTRRRRCWRSSSGR